MMRNFASLPTLAFAVFVSLAVSHCTTGTDQVGTTLPGEQSSVAETNQSANAAAQDEPKAQTGLASANSNSTDYRISPRDILEVSVFQVADLNRAVQVSDDGNITLPLIGVVEVKGKTAHETAKLIGNKLAKKYLQSPQVSVFVKQYGQRVTVNGAVANPRVLAVEGSLTLTQAIAYAGGLNDLADSNRVHVARTSGGQVKDEVYNLNEIQAGRALDPPLQGGDLVVAERSGTQVALKSVKDLLPFAIFASIF